MTQDITLEQMQNDLISIVGEGKFVQFAFYLSPGEQTGLHNPWVKVETEIAVNEYRAYQSRTEDTLEANFKNCLIMLKKDLERQR
jgi:hypothetical protein